MVGIGGFEDLAAAKAFRKRNKVTFPMYWDGTGAAWIPFKVPSNPGAALIDANGRIVKSWYGNLPSEEAVLSLV